MPKRDRESNRQRKPRRYSRNVRKTMQNAYRKYLNDSRVQIRRNIHQLLRLNLTIVKRGQKRCNKMGLAFQPGTSYSEKNPACANFYLVECHGRHMTSRED